MCIVNLGNFYCKYIERGGTYMELTKFERLVLSNQFKILEGLYPEEKEYYEIHRKAIDEGYQLHYNDAFEVLSEDEMSKEDCREVLDILNMYRAITFSYKKLPDNDKSGIREESIKFRGFDLNDREEAKRLMYTRYFIVDLDRFEELRYGDKYRDFNSHRPMLNRYRKMLSRWNEMGKKYELTLEDIKVLIGE